MPQTSPIPCARSAMTQRGTNEVVLLNTGSYPGEANFLNQTDTWLGSTWALGAAQIATSPLPLRNDLSMAYDGTTVTMFGGRGQSETDGVYGDTWKWNGTTWSQYLGAGPTPRFSHKMAYLAGTGAVMFGGSNVLNYLNETWFYNGAVWTQRVTAHTPPVRISHHMAASASTLLLFGGQGVNACLNDTWTFNGTDWTQLTPATSPSARCGGVMAYDTAHSVWVLFGGVNENGMPNPETWTFNGTTWTQQTPAHTPSNRSGAQMCYDTHLGAVMMFGGTGIMDTNNETWKWTGSDWLQL